MLNVFNVFYSISETHSSTQSQIVYSTVTQCPLMVGWLDETCEICGTERKILNVLEWSR